MIHKKIISAALTAVLTASLLCGCFGKDRVDYFEKGYALVEKGKYADALESFLTAAEQGDDQAKTAADIVSGYLNADEAFAIGDIDSAKAFLEGIPDNYKYYDIAEDIDALRRKVYGYNPDAEDKENDEEKSTKEPVADEPAPDNSSTMSPEELSQHEHIDLDLDQVKDLIDSENYETANEYISGLDFDEMTDSQRTKAESMKQKISAELEEKSAQDNEQDFTSQKAIEYIQREYSLNGDMGGELPAKFDSDGNKYYELTFQDGEGEEAPILTVHVYGDGEVRVIERR